MPGAAVALPFRRPRPRIGLGALGADTPWYLDPAALLQVAVASGKRDGVPTRAASESHGIPQPASWIGDRPVYTAFPPNGAAMPPFAIYEPSAAPLQVYSGSGATVTQAATKETVATPVTVPVTVVAAGPTAADAEAAANAALTADVQQQLATLLKSLTTASAAYASAHAAVESAIATVAASELQRLQALTDPAQIAAQEMVSEQRVNAAAGAAYQQWASVNASAANAARVQGASVAVNAGASDNVSPSVVTAANATLSLGDLPGGDTAASWFASIKAAFLAAPNTIRADLAQLDVLPALAANPNDPALSQVPSLESALQGLLSQWTDAAVSYQSIDDAIATNGGTPDSATVTRIVSLAGGLVTFFATKATAEASLDTLARQVLTPDAYAQWAADAPAQGGSLVPWLLLGGFGVALLYIGRDKRGRRR